MGKLETGKQKLEFGWAGMLLQVCWEHKGSFMFRVVKKDKMLAEGKVARPDGLYCGA